MVLPANSQSAQAALHGVRVEGDAGIAQEPLESLPVPQRIADRLAERRARQDRLRRQPGLDARDHRARLRVAQPGEHGQALLGPDLGRPRLDLVQRADLLDQHRGLRVMRLRLDALPARRAAPCRRCSRRPRRSPGSPRAPRAPQPPSAKSRSGTRSPRGRSPTRRATSTPRVRPGAASGSRPPRSRGSRGRGRAGPRPSAADAGTGHAVGPRGSACRS